MSNRGPWLWTVLLAAIGAACSSGSSTNAVISDGGAQATRDAAACPPQQPFGSCGDQGLQCNYGCESCSCQGGTWSCSAPPCGGGCPGGPPPQEGALCGSGCCGTQLATTCTFACPGGAGQISATCQVNGSWHLESSCGATASDGGADAPADDGGMCNVTSSSSLPGVSIAFHRPVACDFTLAQAQAGIAIPYDVIVANDVAGVVPTPQDAGGCGQPGSSGLIPFERLQGGAQSYCLCDTGLCLAMPLPPRTLHTGTYANTFSWDGKNWNGPSDTGNPQGAPFPPGDYTLTVSATGTQGTQSFTVSATLAIRLKP